MTRTAAVVAAMIGALTLAAEAVAKIPPPYKNCTH
jgi:hypothetical protein